MRSSFIFALLAACASAPVPKPIWVQAPSSDLMHPPDKFVCAVGTVSGSKADTPEILAGRSRRAAQAAAMAALRAQVSEPVSPEFDLSAAAEMLGRWSDGDTVHSWGCLDKAKASVTQSSVVLSHRRSLNTSVSGLIVAPAMSKNLGCGL